MKIDKKNPLSFSSMLRIHMTSKMIDISKIAANMIGINSNDGVMFTFNFTKRQCTFYKENEMDSFYFSMEYRHSFSIHDENLFYYFKKCYDLKNEGAYFFNIKKPNILEEPLKYDKISHVFF